MDSFQGSFQTPLWPVEVNVNRLFVVEGTSLNLGIKLINTVPVNLTKFLTDVYGIHAKMDFLTELHGLGKCCYVPRL